METFNDITREMREGPVHSCFVTEVGAASDANRKFRDFADRLDAAYKRDIQAIVDANETAMRTAMGEIAKLRKTNELLECARDLWLERAGELRRRYEALSNGGAK